MQTSLGNTYTPSSCLAAKLLFSTAPTHEGFPQDKAKCYKDNDSAVTQPLASFPHTALYGHRQGRNVSQLKVALLAGVVSIIMESTSFRNTGTDRETAFVGGLLLSKLDPGGVGFTDRGRGPTPRHVLAPGGLACGSRSQGVC